MGLVPHCLLSPRYQVNYSIKFNIRLRLKQFLIALILLPKLDRFNLILVMNNNILKHFYLTNFFSYCFFICTSGFVGGYMQPSVKVLSTHYTEQHEVKVGTYLHIAT